jgi:hypothetical protein
MQRIGRYCIDHEGGRWQVIYTGALVRELVSEHHSKWAAVRSARDLNWRDAHEKKGPPVNERTGGSKEPKSKWRWSIYGRNEWMTRP